MNKKRQQFPDMDKMFRDILYKGYRYSYSRDIICVDIAARFGYIKEQGGKICIANRIFETRLYEAYWMQAEHEEIDIVDKLGDRS